jgi:hypothetical protein
MDRRTWRGFALGLMATMLMLAGQQLRAQTLEVLWYAYSPPGSASQYREKMQAFAEAAHAYPAGSGLRWNVTFFGPGDTPDFGAYDVLVTQSDGFLDDVGGLPPGNGILENHDAIVAARGNRTLLTGLVPDVHIAGQTAPADDGPRGMLVNAINWAGSGRGLGVVALDTRLDPWWGVSFLGEEIRGHWIPQCCGEPITLSPGTTGYPVNAGLTDAGFTYGVQSGLSLAMPGYVAIHQAVDFGPVGVTMVTAGEAGGGTTPPAGQVFWCDGLLPPLHQPLVLPAGSPLRLLVRLELLDEAGSPAGAADVPSPPRLEVVAPDGVHALGALRFNAGTGTWSALLDTTPFGAEGVYRVRAASTHPDYVVEACEQALLRR